MTMAEQFEVQLEKEIGRRHPHEVSVDRCREIAHSVGTCTESSITDASNEAFVVFDWEDGSSTQVFDETCEED